MDLTTRDTAIPDQMVATWQRVVNIAAGILGVPSVMVNRLEPPELEIFRSNISPANPFPSGTRMQMAGVYCAAAAMQREKIQVNDARTDPLWKNSPTAQAGIYAYLGFPVCWPNGDAFGTLCAVDIKEHRWGTFYEDLLLTFRDAIEAHLAIVDTMEQLNKKNHELEMALKEVKTLRGFIPICAACKKIRDDQGYWYQIEVYISEHSDAEFSHGICPECKHQLYPELYKK